MAIKIPTQMRLSQETRRLLAKLAKKLGLTRTAVVEMMTREFAEAKKVK